MLVISKIIRYLLMSGIHKKENAAGAVTCLGLYAILKTTAG